MVKKRVLSVFLVLSCVESFSGLRLHKTLGEEAGADACETEPVFPGQSRAVEAFAVSKIAFLSES